MSNAAFYYVYGDPLNGKWIELDDIDSIDDVIEELANDGFIPRDEQGKPDFDRDLLVADTEGDLANYFYQGYGCFDLDGFIEVRDSDINNDIAVAFLNLFDCWDKKCCEENYLGQYDSPENYARHFCDEVGFLDGIPENLKYYFDFERYANDLMISGICESDGYYFQNW